MYIYIYIYINVLIYIISVIGRDSGLSFLCHSCGSVEGTQNVSWTWLFPLRGQDSLTMTFLGKLGKLWQ